MKKLFNIQELWHRKSKNHVTKPMHPSSLRAFQRHQEHNLKHLGLVDLITIKQNKLTSFIDRWFSCNDCLTCSYCPIFMVYWCKRSKHLAINLEVITNNIILSISLLELLCSKNIFINAPHLGWYHYSIYKKCFLPPKHKHEFWIVFYRDTIQISTLWPITTLD